MTSTAGRRHHSIALPCSGAGLTALPALPAVAVTTAHSTISVFAWDAGSGQCCTTVPIAVVADPALTMANPAGARLAHVPADCNPGLLLVLDTTTGAVHVVDVRLQRQVGCLTAPKPLPHDKDHPVDVAACRGRAAVCFPGKVVVFGGPPASEAGPPAPSCSTNDEPWTWSALRVVHAEGAWQWFARIAYDPLGAHLAVLAETHDGTVVYMQGPEDDCLVTKAVLMESIDLVRFVDIAHSQGPCFWLLRDLEGTSLCREDLHLAGYASTFSCIDAHTGLRLMEEMEDEPFVEPSAMVVVPCWGTAGGVVCVRDANALHVVPVPVEQPGGLA